MLILIILLFVLTVLIRLLIVIIEIGPKPDDILIDPYKRKPLDMSAINKLIAEVSEAFEKLDKE